MKTHVLIIEKNTIQRLVLINVKITFISKNAFYPTIKKITYLYTIKYF